MPRPIGEMLIEAGVIDRGQLGRALDRQARTGERLASICLAMGLSDEETLARTLSRQTGYPFVVLSKSIIPGQALLRIPAGLANILPAMPVRATDAELVVAVVDPYDISVTGELVLATGALLVEHGALAGPLRAAIELAYRSPQQGFVGKGLANDPRLDPAIVSGHIGLIVSALQSDSLELEKEDFDSIDLQALGAEPFSATELDEITLMVVEDDPTTRKMLSTYLSKEGYCVWEAEDGRTAMKMLQSGLPHAFLLDAMLPGIHGFELCRMLKQAEATQHIPVIMISAVYRGKKLADDIRIQQGANAHLEKPLKLKELDRVLTNCLSGRRPPPSTKELSERLTSYLRQASQASAQADPVRTGEWLRRALGVAPFVPSLHYRLARLYLRRDMSYQAIDHLEWTIRLHPNQPARQLLAHTYEKSGFLHKAIEAWKQYADNCTQPDEIGKVRQHIDQLRNLRD